MSFTIPNLDAFYLKTHADELLRLYYDDPISLKTVKMLKDLCGKLRNSGEKLEKYYKDCSDDLFDLLTRICVDSRLDLELRFKVLEVVELKSSGWISCDKSNDVDKNKLEECFKQSEIKENPAFLQNVESDKIKRTSMFSSKVKVGGVEIIVKSKSKVMMENSKKALRGYFSLGNPGNRVFKYSKEQLLALSSVECDDNWINVVKFIPKNLVRAEYL